MCDKIVTIEIKYIVVLNTVQSILVDGVTGKLLYWRNYDNHSLTEQEIADRVRPKFYDAMKCGEPDAIDKALELGLDLADARLYTLMLPCPRCADKIAKTKIKYIVAMTHRTKHNGKFDNPLVYTQKVFDKANIKYDIGEPDDR